MRLPKPVANQHVAMRTALVPLFVVLSCLLMGCTAQRSSDAGGTWQRSELYFGLSRPGADNVSEAEWRQFVIAEVVPAFPGGFTELIAVGHFRQDGTIQHEPVRVLVILNPPEQAVAAGKKLDALGRSYCRRFSQDAVLRSDSSTNLTFLHGDGP
jgi:Protein of unknown function (DUF3574)